MFKENEKAISHSLWLDLRKPDVEAAVMEVFGVIKACLFSIENLDAWAAPTIPPVEKSKTGWNPVIHKVPKGVICLIAYVTTLRFFISPQSHGSTEMLTIYPLLQTLELSVDSDIQALCRRHCCRLLRRLETLRADGALGNTYGRAHA
jgi:hypothetical protein